MSTPKLYHYFLTVRLQPNAETGAPEAVVDSRYPSGELPKAENSLMAMITQFCFPDKEKFPKHNLSPKSKSFTFVVTNIEGVKRYGYVRRSLTGQMSIANQGKRWPICHCILSVFPCASIFDQILEATSRLEPQQVLDLMTQLEPHSPPAPGDAIYASITLGDPGAPRIETFRFARPEQEQSLSGFANFKDLLTTIDPFTIVTILMSLLMERRVIFISRKLSTLSACVQGCVALLYPFTWQHVFIPVLPLGMIQFVCAPVPFVVGLLSSHLPELQAQSELMDEVILIDVESSSPVPPTSDFKLVPEKYLLPLVAAIDKARKVVLDEQKRSKNDKSVGDKLKNFFNAGQGDKNLVTPGARSTVALAEYFKEAQPQDNVAKMIENAFISFFAETMGHYTNYLTATHFQKDAFLAYDPIMTPFLTGVAGSQLFEQFIVQRQNSSRIKGKSQLGALPKQRDLSSTQADLNSDAKLSEVILREGYLNKWGKGMKGNAWARLKEKGDSNTVGTFQLRWWKLSYWTLTYHKSEDAKPSGSIPLQDIEAVNAVDFRNFKDCIEIVTTERVYQLQTDNGADTMWWLEILHWKLGLLREYQGNQPASPRGQSSFIPSAPSAKPTPISSTTIGTSRSLTTSGNSSASSPRGDTSSWVSPSASPSTPPSSSILIGSADPHPHKGGAEATTASAPTPPPRPAGLTQGIRGNVPRTTSKTLVSTYMKDRMSSDRTQAKGTSAITSTMSAPLPRTPTSTPTSQQANKNVSLDKGHPNAGPKAAAPPHPAPYASSHQYSASHSGTADSQVRGRSSALRGQSQSEPSSSPPNLPGALSASHPPPHGSDSKHQTSPNKEGPPQPPPKSAHLHSHSLPSGSVKTTGSLPSLQSRPFVRGGAAPHSGPSAPSTQDTTPVKEIQVPSKFNTARAQRTSARTSAQDIFATTDSAPVKTNSSALLDDHSSPAKSVSYKALPTYQQNGSSASSSESSGPTAPVYAHLRSGSSASSFKPRAAPHPPAAKPVATRADLTKSVPAAAPSTPSPSAGSTSALKKATSRPIPKPPQ